MDIIKHLQDFDANTNINGVIGLVSVADAELKEFLSSHFGTSAAHCNPSTDGLNEDQKYLIYCYCFVYNKLKGEKSSRLEELRMTLALPASIEAVCLNIISKTVIRICRELYEKEGKPSYSVFTDPGEIVVTFINKAMEEKRYSEKSRLEGLDPSEYEHPEDRRLLTKMSMDKSVEKVVKKYNDFGYEKSIKAMYEGSYIKVTPDNIPYLFNVYKEACKALDFDYLPKLYVSNNTRSAFTRCDRDPIIVVSSVVSFYDYDELLFVLGRELGHIKSRHVLYKMLSNLISVFAEDAGNVTLGLGEIVLNSTTKLLYKWYKTAEFTADRAGLLACRNVNAALSVLMKLGGYPPEFYGDMEFGDFLMQAEEFEEPEIKNIDKIIKFLSVAEQDHPWTILRAKELKQWVDSGEYDKVVHRRNVYSQPNVGFNANSGSNGFCPRCGKPVEQGSNFCHACGNKLF